MHYELRNKIRISACAKLQICLCIKLSFPHFFTDKYYDYYSLKSIMCIKIVLKMAILLKSNKSNFQGVPNNKIEEIPLQVKTSS